MKKKIHQKHKTKIIMLGGLGPPKLRSSWGGLEYKIDHISKTSNRKYLKLVLH